MQNEYTFTGESVTQLAYYYHHNDSVVKTTIT